MVNDDCRNLIALWAVGRLGTCHDDSFGYLIGESGFSKVLMQVWNLTRLVTIYHERGYYRVSDPVEILIVFKSTLDTTVLICCLGVVRSRIFGI